MKELGALKAPGPNSFLGIFDHGFWHIVKDDVFQLVKDFFEEGLLIRNLNLTNVVLIPKKAVP